MLRQFLNICKIEPIYFDKEKQKEVLTDIIFVLKNEIYQEKVSPEEKNMISLDAKKNPHSTDSRTIGDTLPAPEQITYNLSDLELYKVSRPYLGFLSKPEQKSMKSFILFFDSYKDCYKACIATIINDNHQIDESSIPPEKINKVYDSWISCFSRLIQSCQDPNHLKTFTKFHDLLFSVRHKS